MRLLLSFLTALCMAVNCHGQFNYTWSVKQEPYQTLTGSTSLNNNMLWDEEIYKVPVGFSFVLDGDTIDSCYVTGPTALFNDTTKETVSAFWTILADLYDRGTHNGGISLSPLSYKTTGIPGNRICKIEIANAGFWDEFDNYGTYNDYINLQVWLYEGSNAVELRYGPSKVSYPVDYFILYSNPLAGLFRMDTEGDTVRAMYYLHGDPANPQLDSVINADFNLLLLPHALDSMPAPGTVYRFEPTPTEIKKVKLLDDVRAYPGICQSELTINNNSSCIVQYDIIYISGNKTRISGIAEKGVHAIDVYALAPGLYLLQLETTGERKTIKFLKQ